MYVIRRSIGVMNALPSHKQNKLNRRKTSKSDGKVQRRKVVNSIPKLVRS